MICGVVRLGDEFDGGAGLVAKSAQQGAFKRDVSCRYWWFLAGARTNKAEQSFSIRISCLWAPCAMKGAAMMCYTEKRRRT